MCQAYEAERASIVWSENIATIAGFKAARNGQPRDINPHDKFFKYRHDAWDHGWGCFKEKILPWALEQLLEPLERYPAKKAFGQSGELPPEILAKL